MIKRLITRPTRHLPMLRFAAHSGELEGALMTLCNPLMDMTAKVDPEMLVKWKLNPNDAILAGAAHEGLCEEVKDVYEVSYGASGSGQNTARAAQWLLPKWTTVFIGCIGKDENGQLLRTVCEGEGIRVEYMEDPDHPTGTCAVLLTGVHRSLVANLGAASKYKPDHLLTGQVQAHIDRAKLIYITGFFFTTSPETIMHLASAAQVQGKLFALNLSAPFLSFACKEAILETLPYVDMIFGNESEAKAFADANGLGTDDPKEIAMTLSGWTSISGRPRTVIITQGADPTIVAHTGSDSVQLFPVPKVDPSEIVDTTGAGDAFVGGFLSQLILEKPLEECVEVGHKLAGLIIREYGINRPKELRHNF